MPTVYSYQDLMDEFRMIYDKGDSWGSVMGAFFPVAAELYFREAPVPPEWGYSPGAGSHDDPRDDEDYLFEVLEYADTSALIKFGSFLERFSRLLKRAGEAY